MTGTDVATLGAQELEALQAAQDAEIDGDLLQTPILKIGQALTKEVQDGNAEPGEFINTLTGEGLGDKLDFVVAYYQTGRFAADRKSNRAYVAFDKLIPQAWSDLVGEEFVGTPFDEYPDAEEVYKERANNKEIEWGSGPLVSTTHNFTGLAVVSAVEGSDEPDELQAVRLSLQRTNVPTARRILTLRRSLRRQPFWSKVFEFSTRKREFTGGSSYILEASLGRDTTADEQAEASALALDVMAGRVVDNQADAPDTPAEPETPKDALGV